jgi:hypothetical protein
LFNLCYLKIKELFRSIKDLFASEYGRKVVTYLILPRDTKFFLKDYTKRLEVGDSTETSKKNAEIKRKELFDYSKPFLNEFLNKEIANLVYNGAAGILIPPIIEKLESQADGLIQKIADLFLQNRYEIADSLKNAEEKKQHIIEDSTSHFVIKQILKLDLEREKKSLLSKRTRLFI